MEAKKIKRWLKDKHNIDYEFNMFGEVQLCDDGDGVVYIGKWELPVPQPTIDEIRDITEEEIITAEKLVKKQAYSSVKQNLFITEPKFALVYATIETLCKTKLNMTDEEFDTFTQSVYDGWVDKT